MNKLITVILILSLVIALALLIFYPCSPPEEKVDIKITVHANSEFCNPDDLICGPPKSFKWKGGR